MLFFEENADRDKVADLYDMSHAQAPIPNMVTPVT